MNSALKVLMGFLVLGTLLNAKPPYERGLEIVFGYGTNLHTSNILKEKFSDFSHHIGDITFGLYYPFLSSLAVSWDIGFYRQTLWYKDDIIYDPFRDPDDLYSTYQTLMFTKELQQHRLGLGLRYHFPKPLDLSESMTVFDTYDLKDTLGYVASYTFVVPAKIVLNFELQYAYTPYFDQNNQSFADESVKIFIKMGSRGLGVFKGNSFFNPSRYF